MDEVRARLSDTRVLVIAEQLRRAVPGGIGTYVRGLLQGLQDVQEVHVGLWASRPSEKPDPLDRLGYPVTTSRLPGKFLSRAWDRNFVAAPDEWELIHATSTAVPPRREAPLTATVHDLSWRAFPDAFPVRGRAWHEASLQRVIERCAWIIVPSQATAVDLAEAGADPARIDVIPHGCDHLPPPDSDRAVDKLRKAGVHGDYLLAVGTLEPRKNLPRLVQAYERVRTEFEEELPLVIAGRVGWGPQLKPSEGVVIIDDASDAEIAALMADCRLLAYIPLLEGYGLPVVEAMSLGAPVVSSNVPAAGGASYLADATNAAAVGDAMVRVADDAKLRTELIARGRAHAAKQTWAASARAHARLWGSLV